LRFGLCAEFSTTLTNNKTKLTFGRKLQIHRNRGFKAKPIG